MCKFDECLFIVLSVILLALNFSVSFAVRACKSEKSKKLLSVLYIILRLGLLALAIIFAAKLFIA